MKKTALILAVLMLCTVIFTSCGKEESGGIVINKSDDASDTLNVKGLDGVTVQLPKNITKIVSLSPSMTSILLGLNASSKIVGVDSVSSGFEGAASLTAVDAAGAAALAPQVAFVPDGTDASALTAAGATVFTVPTPADSIAIRDMIRLAGNVTELSSAAEALIDTMNKTINVSQLSSQGENKKTVYIDLGDGLTTGSDTYFTEMLSAAGAVSAFADKSGFVTVTSEDVIAANPAFIFTVGSAADITSQEGWDAVEAVANGYVYEIDKLTALYPSQTISSIVTVISAAIQDARAGE